VRLTGHFFAVALVSVLLPGCAAFSDGRLTKVEAFPPRSESAKPSVKVTVAYRLLANGSPAFVLIPSVAENDWKKRVMQSLVEPVYFSAVGNDITNPDIIIDAKINNDETGNDLLALVTGLSLFIIPNQLVHTFTFDAKVVSPPRGRERVGDPPEGFRYPVI